MLTKTENHVASPLSRKAVLVSVTISQWSGRKLDRRVTDETNRRYNATKDAGRYNKLLIEAEHLAEINTLASAARTLHYTMTRPWADEGWRVLPNKVYEKFAEEFRKIKRDFEAAADKFALHFPEYVQERAAKLNGLFKADDYPSPTEIREKFKLEHKFMQLPDEADFRSDLDPEMVDDIRQEIADTSKTMLENAMSHTVKQIVSTVGHMSEKLAEYKTGKPGERKFFLDSLVENVRELAELLPAFNLTDDPKLAAIAARISKELCIEDAKELRKNDKAREAVQKSADEIVSEVSKFFA